ncbi:MAG TPA: hypothetical protein VF625_03630 [Longimicrobium sp.]|jgi:hypothetical protein
MAGIAVLGAARVASGVAEWRGAPGAGAAADLGAARSDTLRDMGTGLRARVGAGRALIFVYAPDCGPCNSNMWNWIDVARRARGRPVRLVAATPDRSDDAARYWAGLRGVVDVVVADTTALRDALDLQVTPATLLVENGVVRRQYVGPLTPAAKRRVIGFIEGAALDGAP